MKIGPLESPPLAPAAPERKATPAGTKADAEASAQVELSPAAQQAAAGADGSFDAKKVEGIAQAIRDGKYKVHPEAIADKLIANASELLGRKPS